MLERLYPEYVFLCSFVHGLPDANLFKMTFRKDSKYRQFWSDDKLKDSFRRNVAQHAFLISLVSLAQSAAELTVLYPGNVELMASVTKAWQVIADESLIGKATWNMRTKGLLGILDVSPPCPASAR